jgi:class 3 adenylate cyclase/tetratricopeptide (TPR) repeat protein
MANWLSSHDLANLLPAFEENEIDFDILFELTEDDLKEMGLALGSRKRLRAAIDAASRDGYSEDPTAGKKPHQQQNAERRHLTIMFVDLVGSTELSGRLDPEDMREVMIGYQNLVAGIVTRYEGQVAKYMGDGVLCYFGWPRAHENDAERAVRAGLETLSALAGMKSPEGEQLSGRVGIATGLVVVGDLIGEGSAQEEAVVGDTPNLAARLQTAADKGEVVIAASTRQLIGSIFELADLGMMELKGIAEETQAWRVIAERDLASRFEAKVQDASLPMIGREHELALVMERWERAAGGEGQVIVLSGEAGIGKSRLTRAVMEEVGRADHYRISYHCSPYHTDSSFYPMVQHLEHAAGFEPGEGIDTQLDKLEASLRIAEPRLIAELLQIDGTRRYGPLDLTPQQFRNEILDAISAEIQALSREKPVFVVVEDAHWIDASTLAALEACLDRIAGERVMMLITARPVFEHGFGGHPVVTKLTLNRLGSDQTAAVLSKITGGKRLPAEIVSEIVAKTDGVPLFVEELTKTIIESGELTETADAYELVGPMSRVTIPATLHDSLMARIDRLQPVKEIAQIAACIGREFERSVLAEVARVADTTLDEALGQLERAELVFRRGVPPNARYVFKHALVRDVAYESLLKKRRQEIHHRLADVFEADPATPPELTAYHATEAGLAEKAVTFWGKAGTAAQARPAYDEAANHLKNALKAIGPLLSTPEWKERELSLLVQLAQIYVAKEGYASREASEAFSRALKGIDATDNAELRVAIYYGTWIEPYIGDRLNEALVHSSRLVEEMENEEDTIPRLIARRMRAATLIAMGRPLEALADLEISYQLYEVSQLKDFAARFAQDPGVQIWCYQLLALWMSGEEIRAVELSEQAMARARELKHANTICYAGLHTVTLSIWRGDVANARAINEEMKKIAIEHDMALWKVFCSLHDGVLDCMGDRDGAGARLDAAVEDYYAYGCGLWITLYLAEKAKHLLRLGNADGARTAIGRARQEMQKSGEHWAEAELSRIEGQIFRAAGNVEKSRTAFEDAIAIAREQKARALELRASESLKELDGAR